MLGPTIDRLAILHYQILEAIKLLQEAKTIPIQRARMRIRLTMPSKDGKRLKEEILKNVEKVEEDEWSEEWELVRLFMALNHPYHMLTFSSATDRSYRSGLVQNHQ